MTLDEENVRLWDTITKQQVEIEKIRLELITSHCESEELGKKLSEAQAHIEMLREKITLAAAQKSEWLISLQHDQTLLTALAATPESSLREHDSKLVERIAAMCEKEKCNRPSYFETGEIIQSLVDKIRKGEF